MSGVIAATQGGGFMANTKAIGDIGEQLAAEYLEKSGYVILERNAKYCDCEVDIICECFEDENGNVLRKSKGRSGLASFISKIKSLGKGGSDKANKGKAHKVIVFCEVKTRLSDEYGSGAMAVTPYKVGRYITAAKAYAARHFSANEALRFDIIEIADGEVTHIVNAFDVGDAKYRH